MIYSSKNTYFLLVITLFFSLISCAQETSVKPIEAAQQTEHYLTLLEGKKVGIVANQTSVIYKSHGYTHLVDSLKSSGVNIVKVFSPEHGFRGRADAAELVADGLDVKTGIPITSLYGKNKKPSKKQLEGIDIIVFDIQDLGVRFYTYISTMHYVMEACAENTIPVIILDRPNPNAHYVDGPTLKMEHRSFVGMHKVPVVYGMTIGEYAQMINGEAWLKDQVRCDLTVIPLKNYTHQTSYHLAIRPSPNIPNDQAVNLYPSLGFFEGTTINAGRGTEFQFQRYGASFFDKTDFSYTPEPNFGSKYPKHQGKICYGVDLSAHEKLSHIRIEWLLDAYHKTPEHEKFFGSTFTIHAGHTELEAQIKSGATAEEIRISWKEDLDAFKKVRAKYLLYE